MQLLRDLGCASTDATAAVLVILRRLLLLLLLLAGCLHYYASVWHVAIHLEMTRSIRLCPRIPVYCRTSLDGLDKLD